MEARRVLVSGFGIRGDVTFDGRFFPSSALWFRPNLMCDLQRELGEQSIEIHKS